MARQADIEMTGYVVTRWYRAPEVILSWMHYTQTGESCIYEGMVFFSLVSLLIDLMIFCLRSQTFRLDMNHANLIQVHSTYHGSGKLKCRIKEFTSSVLSSYKIGGKRIPSYTKLVS